MHAQLIKAITSGLVVAGYLTSGASAISAETIRYSTLVSVQHVGVQDSVKPFFDTLEEKSNGELKGRIFPSGQLLSARETLKGIGNGAVDAGLIIPQYFGSEIPSVHIIGDMLNLGDDPLAVAGALNETLLLDCEQCIEEYAAFNAYPLTNYASTEYLLQCNRPVISLKDLSGLRVRAAGIMASYVQVLGANAISLTSSEQAEALERNQIDCTTAPMAWHKAYGLRGSVSHVTDLSIGVSRGFGLFVVNKDSWERLGEDNRKLILDAAPEMVAGIMFGQIDADMSERNWASENGVEIVEPEDELREAIANVPGGKEILLERAKKLGVTNLDELLETFGKNYEKWQGILSREGRSREVFVEALRREIYSKL
ncbi:C4-dicarboxylate TRAP transporter substrate-binding protein [Amorphus sp. MBR-141]